MKKEKTISLAERISRLGGPDGMSGVESLEVLSHRIPFFFQGIAVLTGMRCHRENMSRWSCWESMEETCFQEKSFFVWLAMGGSDLLEADDEEFFINLLLEPMYWLEECAKAQKYETERNFAKCR